MTAPIQHPISAFPLNPTNDGTPGAFCPEPGMTLRDYFAGQVCEQALAEAFANDCLEGAAHTELCEWAALLTYKMADAMLAARQEQSHEA